MNSKTKYGLVINSILLLAFALLYVDTVVNRNQNRLHWLTPVSAFNIFFFIITFIVSFALIENPEENSEENSEKNTNKMIKYWVFIGFNILPLLGLLYLYSIKTENKLYNNGVSVLHMAQLAIVFILIIVVNIMNLS